MGTLATPDPDDRALPAVSSPQMDLRAMMQVSEMLAKSSLVPSAYRGKPENVLLATLAGQAYGWDPTMAMRSFHIIEGQPSMKPEIMLALVRQAGHSVKGDTSPQGATITGTRRDTGDTMTVTFTLEDARRAGLTGRKGPWQQYPQSMCWARALSQLCRMLFPDVVLGAGYTPEEIGGFEPEPVQVQVEQAPVDENGDPMVRTSDAKMQMLELYVDAGFDAGEAKLYAANAWRDAGMPATGYVSQRELDELLSAVAVEVAGAIEPAEQVADDVPSFDIEEGE